ncbi:MAG: universal stress protein, partial [Candidatus Hydrothermarchaeaceae archaeon]
MKLLATTDGSKSAENALRFAGKIASESHSRVTLLHVIPKINTTKEDIIILLKEELGSPKKAGTKYLKDGSEIFEEFGIKAETKLIEGSPIDEILKESEGFD